MPNNSRSETSNAIYPSDPRMQSDEVPTAAQERQDTVRSQGKIQLKRTTEIDSDKPVTVTTTTAQGSQDLVSTLIPALQSSAYVLIILFGFLAWSSRKLVTDFMVKHISLVESLEQNLDVQLETAKVQMDILKQLTLNNERLVHTVTTIAERSQIENRT